MDRARYGGIISVIQMLMIQKPTEDSYNSQHIINMFLPLELIGYGWGHYQEERHERHKEDRILTMDEGFV